MAPPSAVALGATGAAAPASRSSTPTAKPSASRSTIVPFTRPSLDEGGNASGPSSLPRSLAASAPRSLSSSLRRPEWRPPLSAGSLSVGSAARAGAGAGLRADAARAAPVAAAEVVQGFAAAPAPHLASHLATSPARPGLLSRVLTTPAPTAVEEPVPGRQSESDSLLAELESRAHIFATPVVRAAWAIATAAHAGQAARSGVSMAAHCAEVAAGVADLGADADAVAAALLHSALSRGVIASPDALAAALPAGPSRAAVTALVRAVARMSDLCAVRRWSSAAAAAEEEGGGAAAAEGDQPSAPPTSTTLDAGALVDVLLAMADPRAAVIELVDRVVQLRAAVAGGGAGAGAAADDALALYAPLANRLGVWCLKAELEDLAFAARHPEEHAELAARLGRGGRGGGAAPAASALEPTLDAMRAALADAGLGDADLTGRPKHLYGVFTKMRAKGVPLEAVTDVRAVRVIVPDKAACYRALRAVTGRWATDGPESSAVKDYIRTPKPNGYQSLHVVVRGDDGSPVEVQIRTPKMHLVAEYGLAAHWRYKESQGVAEDAPSSAAAGTAAATATTTTGRTSYARWLLAWAYELDDKQVRRGDGLVSRLAAAVSSVDDGLEAAAAHARCGPFPGEHAPDCRFAAFLRKASALPGPGADPGAEAGVPIVVVDHTGGSPSGSPKAAAAGAGAPAPARYAPRVEAVPAGTTAGALAARLATSAAEAAGVPVGAVHVLINDAHVPPGSAVPVEVGDKVDVFADEGACRGGVDDLLISGRPAAPAAAAAAHLDLAAERERLARIFRRPSGPGGSPPEGA